MRALLPMVLIACYTPPDVDTLPWEAPILSSDGTPVEVCAPERRAIVGCTIDGDTFDVDGCRDGAERIRLLGIDTPETEKPGQVGECYADEAAVELARILDQRVIDLSFDSQCTDVTSSERTLAYVWLTLEDADRVLGVSATDDVLDLHGDDRLTPAVRVLVNTYMLVRGFARHYDAEACSGCVVPRIDPIFIAAERLAAVRGEGLWRDCR